MYNYTKYAKILFDICADANCINGINQELKIIANLYNKSDQKPLQTVLNILNHLLEGWIKVYETSTNKGQNKTEQTKNIASKC